MTSLIFSIIIAAVGVLLAVKASVRPLESVSGMAYVLPKWLFSVWVFLTGLLAVPSVFDALSDTWRFLGFLMMAALVFVAATACYREERTALHYAAGTATAVVATFITAVLCPKLLWLWLLYPLVIIRVQVKKSGSMNPSYESEPTDFNVYVLKGWLLWAEIWVYGLLVGAVIVK